MGKKKVIRLIKLIIIDDDEINLDDFDFEKYFIDNDEIKNNNNINKDINYNKNKKYKDDSPISLNESIFL